MKKWKRFERLVAAIHRVEAAGAQVSWNEVIRGRQFDVVMRFKVASYLYVSGIEVKDKGRRVRVDEVEAFVTKARDAGIDKAIMVSASGFQAGAVEVAGKHHIELFTLEAIDSSQPEGLSGELTPVLRIDQICLRRIDTGRWTTLPEDRGLPEYLARQLTITVPPHRPQTLAESIQEAMKGLTPTSKEETREVGLSESATAYLPHLVEEWPVVGLRFSYRIEMARVIRTNVLPLTVPRGAYLYRNVATGETKTIPRLGLGLGFDTVLQPGRFYFNPVFEYSYYCKAVEDDIATLDLVESYQHGMLVQATFTQKVEYQKQFVEIDDPAEIDRLRRIAAVRDRA